MIDKFLRAVSLRSIAFVLSKLSQFVAIFTFPIFIFLSPRLIHSK